MISIEKILLNPIFKIIKYLQKICDAQTQIFEWMEKGRKEKCRKRKMSKMKISKIEIIQMSKARSNENESRSN